MATEKTGEQMVKAAQTVDGEGGSRVEKRASLLVNLTTDGEDSSGARVKRSLR